MRRISLVLLKRELARGPECQVRLPLRENMKRRVLKGIQVSTSMTFGNSNLKRLFLREGVIQRVNRPAKQRQQHKQYNCRISHKSGIET
jgi:hypothetical protein